MHSPRATVDLATHATNVLALFQQLEHRWHRVSVRSHVVTEFRLRDPIFLLPAATATQIGQPLHRIGRNVLEPPDASSGKLVAIRIGTDSAMVICHVFVRERVRS